MFGVFHHLLGYAVGAHGGISAVIAGPACCFGGGSSRGGLRFPDEFVRHKMLDALGDMYLAGAPIVGRFEGRRSGHKLNHRLLRTLFQRREAWCWTESDASESDGSAASKQGTRAAGLAG